MVIDFDRVIPQCFFPTTLGLGAGALSTGKNSDKTGNFFEISFYIIYSGSN
jgi:hypothetical protein